MSRTSYVFTSESVSEGHPDKVSDRISDTVVDLFMARDPEARVACETLTTTNRVVLAGEIRGKGIWENDGWAPGVEAEIEAAVTRLEPDAKSQVSLFYENGVPVRATAIVVSTQHAKGMAQADVAALVKPVVAEVLPAGFITDKTVWHINPTGKFETGGPDGDAGLTGRKIIVDTYGGAAPHGGGAFSGKDCTKVDRSAAYAARYLAKNVVASGLADRCTIQLSYAIGVAEPQSVHVDLHGTGKIAEEVLERELPGMIGGATPRAIREHLGLNKPIYARTAAYGHFGREPEADGGFSWERTDLGDRLKALA